jgi:hypothetical protein
LAAKTPPSIREKRSRRTGSKYDGAAEVACAASLSGQSWTGSTRARALRKKNGMRPTVS